VNDFTEGNDDADLEILRITNEDERKQVARLNDVRGVATMRKYCGLGRVTRTRSIPK